MSQDQKRILVTLRTSDGSPTPSFLGGSIVMACDMCGEDVHVSNSTLNLFKKEEEVIPIYCIQCAQPEVKDDTEFLPVDEKIGTSKVMERISDNRYRLLEEVKNGRLDSDNSLRDVLNYTWRYRDTIVGRRIVRKCILLLKANRERDRGNYEQSVRYLLEVQKYGD